MEHTIRSTERRYFIASPAVMERGFWGSVAKIKKGDFLRL
jgi:hypothetical protein